MAYLGYPYTSYNAYNAFPTQNPLPATQPTQNSLIWIQGEAAAKSYLVAPGNTVALWDSESQTVYLKSADASGMPSMRILDYTIREDGAKTPEIAPRTDFATKDDIVSIQSQIDEIRANMGNRKGGRHEPSVSANGKR